MKLLIDENLSPLLAQYAEQRRGYIAEAVHNIGFKRTSDEEIFAYAITHQQVVVTINYKDFLYLAQRLDPHPGVIVIREAGLSRSQQWERLDAALEYLEDLGTDLINQILEVKGIAEFRILQVPSP
ncbi:DUF5615 family PIN-like protein [Synechococcus elongatus IITB7]|uniref:DUF5615 family PIN-like protein n=1 Tax=Synechococcus elongatus TaxID=32046 RepID=UPI0030CCB41D